MGCELETMPKAMLRQRQDRGTRAACWGSQAITPAGEERWDVSSCSAGKPTPGFWDTSVPLWLLSVSQKDTWRRHLGFLYKKRLIHLPPSSLSNRSLPRNPPAPAACGHCWLGSRCPTLAQLQETSQGPKPAQDNQLKGSLLSLSRAFTKHNSAKMFMSLIPTEMSVSRARLSIKTGAFAWDRGSRSWILIS